MTRPARLCLHIVLATLVAPVLGACRGGPRDGTTEAGGLADAGIAEAPRLEFANCENVSPDGECLVDFGSVKTGTSDVRRISIRTSFKEDSAGKFDQLVRAPFTVSPAEPVFHAGTRVVSTLDFTFAPSAQGSFEQSVQFKARGEGLLFRLRGRGEVAPVPPCVPVVTELQYDFGADIPFAPPSGQSHRFSMSNKGSDRGACIWDSPRLAGADESFLLSSGAPPESGPGQEEVNATVWFDRRTYGLHKNSLIFHERTTETQVSVALAGEVKDPCPGGNCGFANASADVYLTDGYRLYSFDSTAKQARQVALFSYDQTYPCGTGSALGDCSESPVFDLAIDSGGKLWGCSRGFLFRIDAVSGVSHYVTTLPGKCYGLAALSTGEVAVATTDSVLVVDPHDGHVLHTFVPPLKYWSSGDIAELTKGQLYWTVVGGDGLVRIDIDTGAYSLVGSAGVTAVDGLARDGNRLLGYTNNGSALVVDPTNATVTSSSSVFGIWLGAASRPPE